MLVSCIKNNNSKSIMENFVFFQKILKKESMIFPGNVSRILEERVHAKRACTFFFL